MRTRLWLWRRCSWDRRWRRALSPRGGRRGWTRRSLCGRIEGFLGWRPGPVVTITEPSPGGLRRILRHCYYESLSFKPPHVTAIYPGSFDPITFGHLDVIQRGALLFDRLIVSILRNETKAPLFSVEERMEMLREVLGDYPNVAVDSFGGLLVEHAAEHGATVLLRGIRAISDYENEWQMALMNRRLRPGLETVFMMASETHSFISSRLVKEVFSLGGNVAGLVPPSVEARLRGRLAQATIS